MIHLLAIASHYSGGKRKTRSLEQQNQDANFDSQKEKTKIANLDLDFGFEFEFEFNRFEMSLFQIHSFYNLLQIQAF